MLENEDIHGAILAIMESLRLQGTSQSRLKNYKNSYNVFERYLSDNCISRATAKAFIYFNPVSTWSTSGISLDIAIVAPPKFMPRRILRWGEKHWRRHMLTSCRQVNSRIGRMIKIWWTFLLHLAVNDKMVSESMSNLLVRLVCCRHSPFYITHHNAWGSEVKPIPVHGDFPQRTCSWRV